MALVACLIVRDNERIIRRCLESVQGLVDRAVIVDTGSIDNTLEVIRDAAADLGIPVRRAAEPWQNAGYNRTHLLNLANETCDKSDWLLLLDADRVVKWTGLLDYHADAKDAGMVKLTMGERHWRVPLLLRAGKPWRYRMRAHEYLDCDEPYETFDVEGLEIEEIRDEGAPAREGRSEATIAYLREDLREDPNNARAVFYLAETCRESGRSSAAIEWYERRLEMEGFYQERWYSQWRLGELLSSPVDLLHAYEMDPTRAEPLHSLACHFRLRGEPHTAAMFAEKACEIDEEPEGLFVQHDVYAYLAKYELGIACQQCGYLEEARTLGQDLLGSDIPDWVRETVEKNLALIPTH